MNKKITIMREDFENEQTGEKIEGITVIVDGILKQFFGYNQSQISRCYKEMNSSSN